MSNIFNGLLDVEQVDEQCRRLVEIGVAVERNLQELAEARQNLAQLAWLIRAHRKAATEADRRELEAVIDGFLEKNKL